MADAKKNDTKTGGLSVAEAAKNAAENAAMMGTKASDIAPATETLPDLPGNGSEPKGGHNIQAYLNNDKVKQYIEGRIGKNVDTFISAIMAVVNGKPELQACSPKSILAAAIEASTLNLSVNPNLGQAAIVPYKNKGKDEAQFQMMYKGFVQMAQRSGQYKSMSAGEVYEGQLVNEDPMMGNTYDWNAKTSDKVVGYFAYFKLLNGFEKDDYISAADARKHAQRYSKAFRAGFGPWKDNFDGMGIKTVLKRVIDKFGPKSVEMERAILLDQGVLGGETGEPEYLDNTTELEDAVSAAKTPDELSAILQGASVDDRKKLVPMVEDRLKELEK